MIGPQADDATLARLRAQVLANPRGWIAQRPVALSTAPVLTGEGLGPRHIDLRPFAVHDGSDVWLVPGGLTRVAGLPEVHAGGQSPGRQQRGSKDTWVLAPGRGRTPGGARCRSCRLPRPESALAPESRIRSAPSWRARAGRAVSSSGREVAGRDFS